MAQYTPCVRTREALDDWLSRADSDRQRMLKDNPLNLSERAKQSALDFHGTLMYFCGRFQAFRDHAVNGRACLLFELLATASTKVPQHCLLQTEESASLFKHTTLAMILFVSYKHDKGAISLPLYRNWTEIYLKQKVGIDCRLSLEELFEVELAIVLTVQQLSVPTLHDMALAVLWHVAADACDHQNECAEHETSDLRDIISGKGYTCETNFDELIANLVKPFVTPLMQKCDMWCLKRFTSDPQLTFASLPDVAFAAVQSLDPSLQFPVTKQAIISIVRSLEANQTTMALPNPVSVS